MKIYISGPLFTAPERHFNRELARALVSTGHEVWLPQETSVKHNVKDLFRTNMAGVTWADLLVANMDGSDPDSGTCFECGCAYGKKLIIAFRTDTRLADEPGLGTFNLMLEEAATMVLHIPALSIESVIARIVEAVQRLLEKELGK